MYTGIMGGFYRISEWIMRFAYVNILWIAFTLIGLVFLGFFPATASLFAVVRKWIQGNNEVPIFSFFWTNYKSSFLKSNILGISIVIIG